MVESAADRLSEPWRVYTRLGETGSQPRARESGCTWLREAEASQKALRNELCDRYEAVLEKRFLADMEFQMTHAKEKKEKRNKNTRSIKLKWTALAFRLLFSKRLEQELLKEEQELLELPEQKQEQALLAEIARLQTENAELKDEVGRIKRKHNRPSKAARDFIKRQQTRGAPVQLGEGLAADAAACHGVAPSQVSV